jgi:hypothetical protein
MRVLSFKGSLLFCFASFFATVISAQNVGIGTTNPTGRLHIDLNGTATPYAILIDDDDDPVIRLRKANVSKSFLEIAGDDFRIGTYATNPLGRLILRTNSADRMSFTPGGNIGVGITNPTSRFQITGGDDVSLTLNGYLMLGTDGGQNLVFDNNEIQARNDSAIADLFLQAEGGVTQFGKTTESNIEIGNTTIAAYYNGSSEELILQPNGKTRVGSFLDFANTKFHISEGVDAGVANNQSGYMMIGRSNGENVVFDNNEILARNNGAVSTLFLARDGSKVQLGNGTEASGTKLHITTGNDAGLPDNESGYIMMGSQAGINMVMDNNEIQARNNGAYSDLFLQANGGKTTLGRPFWVNIEVENTTISAFNNGSASELILQPNGKTRLGGNSDLGNTKFHISEGVDAGLGDNTSGYMMIGLSNSGNVVFDNNEIMARNNGTGSDLFLQHDGGNLILCGTEQGSVGIGVTSGASIPAGYMLAVDGKIISEELKVQMSGSWPDYVFARDYNLRPLTELRKYIAANKHLPGIPPAAEVEKNGIEVGDMQKRMMEKIEELTLYILQLEKDVAELKKKSN